MTNQVEPTTLKLISGSTKPFDIVIYDDNDVLAVLAGATAGTFIIKRSVNDSTSVLVRTTTGITPTLTLDIPNSKLIGALSQEEADDLPVGVFIGMISVQFGANWEDSDPFIVEITPGFASHA